MKKATDFKNQWLSNWWAHLDSNQGPKDYEQPQEIKPITNHKFTSDLQRCGSKCGTHSGLTPDSLIILAHFVVSFITHA
jgi:hypothetical protein